MPLRAQGSSVQMRRFPSLVYLFYMPILHCFSVFLFLRVPARAIFRSPKTEARKPNSLSHH